MRTTSAKRRPNGRRGAVLVVVLVCLVLLTVVGGALLRLMVLERNLLDARERRCQARWLVEAGLERAAARLAADPKYSGETWTLDAQDMAEGEPGLVKIEIAPASDTPGRRKLTVTADYPPGAPARARASKEIEFETPAAGETR